MKRAGNQIVLVGTYRSENADWIAAKRIYNLPLPKCGKLAFHARVGGLPDDRECVSAACCTGRGHADEEVFEP